MKHTERTPLLILLVALLMPVSSALAQSTEDQKSLDETIPPTNDLISAARSSYTSNAQPEGTPRTAEEGLDLDLAQLPRNRPGPPPRPHRGYAPESYPTHWMDHGSPRHVLIGALIGFGVGAALAAKADKTSNPGAAIVLVGGAGALIGAAVGANHGGPGRFAHHRRIDAPSGRKGKESDLSADSAGRHSDDKPAVPTVSLSSRTLALR